MASQSKDDNLKNIILDDIKDIKENIADINITLAKQEVILGKQEVSLDKHIRRTDNNEIHILAVEKSIQGDMQPIKEELAKIRGSINTVMWLALLAVAITQLIDFLKH